MKIDDLLTELIKLKNNGVKRFLYRLKFGPSKGLTYQDWFFLHRIKEEELDEQKNTVFSYSPKISIIVATFNVPEKYLNSAIRTTFGDNNTFEQVDYLIKCLKLIL